MKSVGNLTDFVRNHMLEPFDVEPRVSALITHFDDLNRAHEAVLRPNARSLCLQPLVADCDRHAELARRIEELRACREPQAHFARLKLALLDKRSPRSTTSVRARRRASQGIAENARAHSAATKRDLNRAIAENGGDRIARLRRKSAAASRAPARQRRAARYAELRRRAGPAPPTTPTPSSPARRLAAREAAGARRRGRAAERADRGGVAFRGCKQEHDERRRRDQQPEGPPQQHPQRAGRYRAALCTALGLRREDMPFAGELLQVREDERDWEGAAERLLRNFGLSLLVPDATTPRSPNGSTAPTCRDGWSTSACASRPRRDAGLHADSLVRKLAIKPDSPFYDWLEREVVHRFDVACCTTQDQFRRETRAITRAGQIKAPGERHEKDDRHRIDDRSRFMLGWTNAAKIAALEAKARRSKTGSAELGSRIARPCRGERFETRLDTLSKLDEYRDFRELDWHRVASRGRAAAGGAPPAGVRLRRPQGAHRATCRRRGIASGNRGAAEDHRTPAPRNRAENNKALRVTPTCSTRRTTPFSRPASTRSTRCAPRRSASTLTVESCDHREQDMRDWLQARIDTERQKPRERLRERIVRAMSEYNGSLQSRDAGGGREPSRPPASSATCSTSLQATTCLASRPASRNCSTRTPSARSPISSPS